MVAHLKKEILSGKSGYWDLPLENYAHERMGDLDFYGMAEDGNWEAQYDAATDAVLAGVKPLERKHELNRQRY